MPKSWTQIRDLLESRARGLEGRSIGGSLRANGREEMPLQGMVVFEKKKEEGKIKGPAEAA